MDLKLQDIKQQAAAEIIASCSRCDQSAISITEEVFRCFPGSESAVTYRALLHENCRIPSLELEGAIERWLSSGMAIVVRSLVLKADSSCPVVVTDVNNPECVSRDVRFNSDPRSGTSPNTIAVIVGGSSGAMLGAVLLIGVVIIVVTIAITKHRQVMARLMIKETRYCYYCRCNNVH